MIVLFFLCYQLLLGRLIDRFYKYGLKQYCIIFYIQKSQLFNKNSIFNTKTRRKLIDLHKRIMTYLPIYKKKKKERGRKECTLMGEGRAKGGGEEVKRGGR